MVRYKNLNGNSGIKNYGKGADYIDIEFRDRERVYRYSYQKAGMQHVEQMKTLADKGQGLNTYLNKHVKNLFD